MGQAPFGKARRNCRDGHRIPPGRSQAPVCPRGSRGRGCSNLLSPLLSRSPKGTLARRTLTLVQPNPRLLLTKPLPLPAAPGRRQQGLAAEAQGVRPRPIRRDAMTRFSVDLRLIEIEYELWALGQFLEFIEPQIQYLHDQDRIRTFAQLREAGWDHDEAELDLASQEIRERQQYVVPRFMRGPVIVALSACFQAGRTELANYKKRELDAPLSLNEIRAEDYLKQARRYFEAVLQM